MDDAGFEKMLLSQKFSFSNEERTVSNILFHQFFFLGILLLFFIYSSSSHIFRS